MKPYRILSIDGGGLRGILPLRMLQEIEKYTGKRVHELFDMMAGTSTGGLIASCLTLRSKEDPTKPRYTTDDLIDMYTGKADTIFPIRSGFHKFLRTATTLWNPEFDGKGLEKVLKEYITEERIKDSLLPLVIASYDLQANKPLFFKTSEASEDETANARIYDVCRATSAAPTFLPAYSFVHKKASVTAIDGGVYINDPAMAATAEILRYADCPFYNRSGLSQKDIVILSLGTGSYTGSITEKEAASWGQLQWITRITDIMMKGVSQSTDYEISELLEDGQYLRLNVNIEEEKYSNMTDASADTRNYLLDELNKQLISTGFCEANKSFLNKLVLNNLT
ncbi:MAG: patatin [Chitinophagaceae bacterium]|nr:patatin [Chitinophagaceae bacterium]